MKANTNPADLAYVALANPATILELCTLLEKAEEALNIAVQIIGHPDDSMTKYFKELLTAIKQWKEKT